MQLTTISNLYPRPDRPQFGLFNAQLFRELAALGRASDAPRPGLANLVLVPEWRLWRWPAIRRWRSPYDGGPRTEYVPVFYVPGVGRRWSAATYAVSLRRRRTRLPRGGCVLASWLYPDGVAAARLARSSDSATWVMVLGSDIGHLEAAPRARQILDAARHVRGFVCVAEPLAQRLRAAGIDAERVHVVPNGIDTALFNFRDRGRARAELGIAGGVRLVLFAGNLVDEKAPEITLQAVVSLMRQAGASGGEPPMLVMLGDGGRRAVLERTIREAGVEARVRFVGSVPQERVALWMNAADCLSLSSRREGMPNVVLEALASGLPVVCSDVGVCREMVAGEEAARVVPAGDPAAQAAAIGELLTAVIDRRALARRHGRYSRRDQAQAIWRLMGLGNGGARSGRDPRIHGARGDTRS